MAERHDIFDGSPAWQTLEEGIPQSVDDRDLRRLLHAYRDVTITMAAHLNNALDAHQVLSDRIQLRKTEHEALDRRLFDSEKGVLPTFAKREAVSRLTTLLWTVLSGVVVAALMLAADLLAKGGHA